MSDARHSRRGLVCAALLAGVCAVYLQVRHHQFVDYDDPIYITKYPEVQQGLSLEGIRWAFASSHADSYTPLTWVSYMVDQELFGLDPAGTLLTNVLIHALSSALLFLVLCRITGAFWRSAFVAGVFALHPLQVESVAWAAERKGVLAGFFWMLTLWAYAGYLQKGRSWFRYLLVALFLLMGLSSKPILVTLPFALLLLDYWPLGRLPPSDSVRPIASTALLRALLEKLPLFALVAATSVVTYLAQEKARASIETVGLDLRLQNALVSYARYLGKSFWPTGLAAIYPLPAGSYLLWQVVGAAALVLAVSGLALWALWSRRWPYLPVGWFWYLGTLVPVIGVVQIGIQAGADRWTYIPMIGLSVVVAWGGADLARRLRVPAPVVACLGGGSLVGLALLAWLQVGHWRDGVSLFEHAVRVDDRNYAAYSYLGAALLDRGRTDEALGVLRRSLVLRTEFSETHSNLAEALRRRGQLHEAVVEYRSSLRLHPDHAWTHINLGVTLIALEQYQQAAEHLEAALRLQPPETWLAKIHGNLGLAQARLGHAERAMGHYRRSLAIEPEVGEVRTNLGLLLLELGRFAEAEEQLREALRLDPGIAEVQFGLAQIEEQRGRTREAAVHYREALRLRPNWPAVVNNLAWLLATDPQLTAGDREEAVRLAESLFEATAGTEPEMLDTLATAYAAAGRFDEAVETAARALEQARLEGSPGLAEEIAARLRLFERGESVR